MEIQKNVQLTIPSRVDNCFFKRLFKTHSFFEGFVEMIDNSIDAEANHVYVTYNREESLLAFRDNGHGYIPETIQDSLSFGVDIERNENAIGANNCGSKAAPYYFINDEKTNTIIEKIESNHNGIKTIVERKIDLSNEGVENNLDNKVTFLDTYDDNGTTVTFKGFICSEEEYTEVKRLINARYYKKIANGSLVLTVDGEVQNGIDMLYRDKDVDKKEVTIMCQDENGEFEVKVLMVDTQSYLKNDNGNGNTAFNEERLNEIDKNQSGKSSSAHFAGVYICHNDIYVTMGGEDSFKHLKRAKHQYLNNCRIEIDIPIDRKKSLDGIIKTATKKYLSDIKCDSKEVYANLFKWWKQNSPSKKVRKTSGEDLKKCQRNAFSQSIEWFKSKLENLNTDKYNNDEALKELFERIRVCIEGKKVA